MGRSARGGATVVARTVVKKQRAPNFRGWWLTPLGRCSGGIGPVLLVSEGGECVSSGSPSELVATVRCLIFKIVCLWVVGLGAGGQNDQVLRSFTTTVGGVVMQDFLRPPYYYEGNTWRFKGLSNYM